MLEIKDSVAVITGGAGGIGLALAEHRVRQGGNAILADIADEPLQKAQARLKSLGGEVGIVTCNVYR